MSDGSASHLVYLRCAAYVNGERMTMVWPVDRETWDSVGDSRDMILGVFRDEARRSAREHTGHDPGPEWAADLKFTEEEPPPTWFTSAGLPPLDEGDA